MTQYDNYKPSGIPWLDEVPEHWKVLRNGNIFYEVVDTNHPNLDLLSLTITKGVVKQSSTGRKIRASENRSLYKKISIGDIGYNLMNAFFGGIGVSNYEGILSPAYAICRMRFTINPKYYHYLFRTSLYMGVFNSYSYGIMFERNRLYFEKFKLISSPVPPLPEQVQIARFLDWKTAQINQFIKAKKKIIELLKEQKQAIINDAVTGKIDVRTGKPYPKYKPSGVEWLGDIPKDWEVIPLKRLIKSNSLTLTEKTEDDYEFYYLEINNVKSGYILQNPQKIKFDTAPSRARRRAYRGDTIISTVRTYLRSVLFIENDYQGDLIVSTGFSVLTPESKINPKYLGFLLRCDNFIDRVIQSSIGVSYPAIADSRLIALKVAIPSIIEQNIISEYIITNTETIELAITRINKELELIQEYKTRLIADVVTGKIDVRGIVVPEVIEEIEEEILDEDNEEIEEIEVEE